MNTHHAGLYWRTLRHLTPGQIAWRGWRMLRRSLPEGIVPAPQRAEFNPAVLRNLRVFMERAAVNGLDAPLPVEEWRNRNFSFLGIRPGSHETIPWDDKSLPRLWRYQLHGFRIVRALAADSLRTARLGDRDRAEHWMCDWMRRNPAGADAAWDPYPVAERLLNWALAMAVFDLRDKALRRSFALQTRWLRHRLERDLRANHLLRETVALAVAEALLGGGGNAVALLQQQVSEQILPDGGHYERSPMYHAIVFFDLLTVGAALPETAPWLHPVLARMAAFLAGIIHADGEPPLFNDSVLDESPPPQVLLKLAEETTGTAVTEPKATAAFSDSGFYILGCGAARMIIKTAAPSPPFQPGHSHADPFSFELEAGGRRLIVDAGMHGYAESRFREYGRSIRAHNTLQINGGEPMEAWSVFRVGARHTTEITEWSAEAPAKLSGICRWPQGYRHERVITHAPVRRMWRFQDTATGGGPLQLTGRLHFHPEVMLSGEPGNNRLFWAKIGRLAVAVRLETESATLDLDAENHVHSPRFGVALPCPTLVFALQGRDCAVLNFSIEVTET